MQGTSLWAAGATSSTPFFLACSLFTSGSAWTTVASGGAGDSSTALVISSSLRVLSRAIALSLIDDEIVPLDVEGSYYMPSVPIVGRGEKVYGGKMADDIARALIDRRIAMVYAHGSFAAGRDLYEAHHFTSTLEESCRIIAIFRQLKNKE